MDVQTVGSRLYDSAISWKKGRSGGRQLNREHFVNQVVTRGGLPAEERAFAWKYLLGVPHNEDGLGGLAARPLEDGALQGLMAGQTGTGKELAKLRRALASLTAWCPPLREASFMPSLAAPFARM